MDVNTVPFFARRYNYDYSISKNLWPDFISWVGELAEANWGFVAPFPLSHHFSW
jgi:hypothetical protein